jgi:hypothetical protein
MISDDISISTVTAKLLDENNSVVITATNTVTFTIQNEGGTWVDGSVVPQSIPCFNGVATIKVKSTKKSGGMTVNATVIVP